MIALAMLAAAKLVMPGNPPTVISYPTMQRCLAAKAAIIRQHEEQAARDRTRGFIRGGTPAVYCVPS